MTIPTPTATLGLGPSRPVFGTPRPASSELPTATATAQATATRPLATATATEQNRLAPAFGGGISLASAPVPDPAPGSSIVTVVSGSVPANPLLPITVQTDDGRRYQLSLDVTQAGQVQVWSGLLGEAQGRWVPARGELLWPGALLYVQGQLAGDAAEMPVESVRIARLPQQPRMVTSAVAEIAQARRSGRALALVGSRDEPGIYLLESSGALTSIGENGQRAIPAPGDPGGLIIPAPNAPAGLNSFTFLRDDGALVEVFAQPFYNMRGIAPDGAGGILWIETPQVELNQWQLWQYRVQEDQIVLLAQDRLDVFGSRNDPVLPSLVAAIHGDAGRWWYLIETAKPQHQQTSTGFFQLTLDSAGRADDVRLLMPDGAYRAPLHVSPDGTRLAYFSYDSDHPSLTAGFVQPSNRLWIRPVGDQAFGNTPALAGYMTENRFEFLTPSFAWRDNQRIVLTRSRFAPVGIFALDTFGITQIDLSGNEPQAVSYLLRTGNAIADSAICQDDSRILLSVVDESGVYRLAEWKGSGKPAPLADLPMRLDRIFACWRLPHAPFTINQPLSRCRCSCSSTIPRSGRMIGSISPVGRTWSLPGWGC